MYQMEEMPPEEMDDNEYMTKNLIETVTLLCRNNLKYNFELKIQGLLAITTDNQNVIVVQINEALPKKASSVTHMGSGSNMMDCGPPSQGPPRGMVGNIPSVSGMPRGRATHMKSRPSRRGGMGGMPRMKQPAMLQNQVTPRLRVRQQQFSKPQKRPIPSMMRSPGSAPIRAPMLQMSPQQHMDEDSATLVPYEPPTLRRTQVRRPQAVRPKAELVEGDEAFVAPKRPIKRELSSSQPSSEICVLSDEEDINPPLLKAEVNQSPLRKRQMPMLSSELDESSCSGIQDSIGEISGTEKVVAVQRVQVKSEAMPSVEVDSVKEETEWSTSSQWQETSHCCSQCMLTFPNMRGLRQHVRNAHPDGVPISSKALVMMVDSVITSPASSSTNVMHSSCRIDDDLGEII